MTTGKALTVSGSRSLVVSSANLPNTVSNGILDILSSFSAQNQEDTDKRRLLRVFGEAVCGFDTAVVDSAINWLKKHNPRNPWRPSPQDLYETCEATRKLWCDRVVNYFTGSEPMFVNWRWEDGSGYVKPKCDRTWGAPPFTDGAIIPPTVAKAFLLESMASAEYRVVEIPAARFDRIPVDCFPNGLYDRILKAREDLARREIEAQKRREYLASLGPELQRYRAKAALELVGEPEDKIIARAREYMAAANSEADRRKQDAEDDRKRAQVHTDPEVQSAIQDMRAAREADDGAKWDSALQAYLQLLTKHGAKPPPHISVSSRRATS